MDKRKGIILAVVIFLLIGLGTFVFANPSNESLKGNDNNTNKNNGTDNDVNDDLDDENANNDGEEDGGEEDNTPNTNSGNGGNQGGSGSSGSSEGSNDNQGGSNTPSVDTRYNDALAAVEKAEKTLNQEDVDYANSLVQALENNDNKTGLVNRVDAVQNIIDVTALVKELQDKTNSATDKESLNIARDFRVDEDVVAKVGSLTHEERKNELTDILDELATILDDIENPVISGIEDGTFTNENVSITISDTNDVTILLNEKEVSLDDLKNLSKEGEYTLVVTDEAFNSSTITFTIDKTIPKISGLDNGYEVNKNEIITISDSNLESVTINGQEQTLEGTTYTKKLTGGTYEIIAIDKAGNKTEITVLVDKNAPIISGVDKEYNNKSEIVTIKDDHLVSVTVNGVEQEITGNTFEKKFPSDGTYEIVATDKVGNTSKVTFTIDKTKPMITKVPENGSVVNHSVSPKIEDKNLDTVVLTKNGKVVEGYQEAGMYELSHDGVYTITALDKAGNKTEVTFTIDKTPIEEAWLYVLNKTYHNMDMVDKHYQVIGDNQELYVELVFEEEFDSIPQIKIGNGEAVSMACGWTDWDTEEDYFKCDVTIRIDGEAQGLVHGEEVPIYISNIKDEAGNETILNNDHVTTSDKYSQVIYDNEAPVANWVYILNGSDEDNRQFINDDQSLIIEINMNEELIENPVVTIGDYEIELTRREHDERYIYSKSFKIDAEAMKLVNNQNIEFTIEVKDAAGNVNILDNGDVTCHESSGYGQVEYDNEAPNVVLKKWMNDDNHLEVEPGKHNYCVLAEINDKNLKSAYLNEEEYENGTLICDDGEYSLTAIDKAGNEKTIEFVVDRTYPIVNINGTDYQGVEDAGRFDEVNIEVIEDYVSSITLWYNDKQVDYEGFDFTQEGTYKLEVRDEAKNKTVITFYVGKYTASIELVEPESLVYDGKEKIFGIKVIGVDDQEITNPNLEVVYKRGQEVIYDSRTEEFATYPIDAGTYNIIVYSRESGDYKPAYISKEFTIAKADTSFTLVAPESLVYDGTVKKYEVILKDQYGNVLDEAISITYKNASSEKVDAIDAGQYSISAHYAGNKNYNKTYRFESFEIVKATPTIEVDEPTSFVYDGSAKEYQVHVFGADGKEIEEPSMSVLYQNMDTEEFLDSAPVDVGNYRVGIYVRENSNYTRADLWVNFEIFPEDTITVIDGVAYSSLEEAINHSDGETITLMNDVQSDMIQIADGKEVTIDLNGNDIVFGLEQRFNVTNGTLNLTGKGTVKESDPYYAPVLVTRDVSDAGETPIVVNIGKDVTLEGWAGIFIDQNKSGRVANTTINFAGKINSVLDTSNAAGHGIYINGSVQNKEDYPVINIKDTASIQSLGDGIYAAGYAEWNIEGGYIEAPEMAIGIKAGILNITGGKFVATGEKDIPTETNNNGINGAGVPLQIESNTGYAGNIKINISGGVFESKNTTSIYEYTNSMATSVSSININGGTFISNGGDANIVVSDYFKQKFSQFITGGTFNHELTEFVVNGYSVSFDGTNYIVVKD